MAESHTVTVKLIPAAKAAVEETAALLGMSEVNVINRAVQVYAHVEIERHASDGTLALVADDGTTQFLRFSHDAPHVRARYERWATWARMPWWRRLLGGWNRG